MKKVTIIDNETGEIIADNYKIDTQEDRTRKKNYATKSKETTEFKETQEIYLGNFIFFIYEHMKDLQKVLNDNELVKFLYIGTFVHKNNALMLDNNKTHIDKKMLKKILGIANKSFHSLFNKFVSNNLLIEKDGYIYLASDYFWKGTLNNYKKANNKKIENFTRIYIKTIRDLYVNTPVKSHRRIAIAYKLLPYVNYKYNVLCTNVYETDKSKINLLTIKDVMNILNYNIRHIARFKKDFYTQEYKGNGIFSSVQKQPEYLDSIILVNPIFFYKGNDIKELQYLITLFNLQPNNIKI